MSARIPHLHLPMRQPTDIIPHLGKGELHWKEGRSAHALCMSWAQVNAIPASVRRVLATHPGTARLELVDGFFERLVELGDGRQPSQTDLMAICSDEAGLLAMAVEGKVTETFGPTVKEWRNGTPTKERRLENLCLTLSIGVKESDLLRYQLLHRTVSALREADRYKTSRAMMLVQSFCPKASGFADFARFTACLGFGSAEPDTIIGPNIVAGKQLFMAWVADSLPPPLDADRGPLQ
jgi:hypothetical protein